MVLVSEDVNGSPNFSVNFRLLVAPWGLIPQTSAPRSVIVSLASRNSHASTVQPGVSSLG
jgi:hypothetical protein